MEKKNNPDWCEIGKSICAEGNKKYCLECYKKFEKNNKTRLNEIDCRQIGKKTEKEKESKVQDTRSKSRTVSRKLYNKK